MLVNELVTSFLPFVVNRLEPFLVEHVSLKEPDANSLVHINKVIADFDYVLIGVILRNVHHPANLHL